jgi:hypothetical protein
VTGCGKSLLLPCDPVTAFDPEKIRIPEDKFQEMCKRRKPAGNSSSLPEAKRKPRSKSNQLLYYIIPAELVEALGKDRKGAVAMMVVCTLLKRRFRRFGENPVKLTNESLKEFGVSRTRKNGALMLLQETGFIEVQKRTGKSSLVTLKWLPVK